MPSSLPLALIALLARPAAAVHVGGSPIVSPTHRAAPPRALAAALASEEATTMWSDLTSNALRLTDAQLSRTVMAVCTQGTFCTILDAPDFKGAAFASGEAYVCDSEGAVLLALSSDQSKSNLDSQGRASFFVSAPAGGAAAGSSVTLIGSVDEISVDDISDADLAKVSATMGETVEEVAKLPWRRLVPDRVHVSDAVRDVEAWVAAADYAEAAANPLAPAAANLLKKMNGAHADSLKRFAAVYGGLEASTVSDAELLSVDQLGFDLRVTQGSTSSITRIGFRLPPANEEEGVSVFMKLFQEAYERQQGWM